MSLKAMRLQHARKLKKDQRCVVILPVGIRNYMNKLASEKWIEALGFKKPVIEDGHWWWSLSIDQPQLATPPVILKSNATSH
ncbi:cystathionine beta-synthase-like [Drosophila takahashii]|uniref:cystathionine beta-synthase-like n=1 Tax=Drosophila takahashii TaxID=29030 RepID=UPI003898D5D9